jgi:hypothetical protein
VPPKNHNVQYIKDPNPEIAPVAHINNNMKHQPSQERHQQASEEQDAEQSYAEEEEQKEN